MADQNKTDMDPSHGTDQAVERMEKILSSGNTDRDTVLVNIRTLMRNRNRSGVQADTLVQEAQGDMQRIAQSLASMMNTGDASFLVLLFYTADYRRVIPEKFRRGIPPSRAAYDTACSRVLDQITTRTEDVQGLPVHTLVLNPVHKIHRELSSMVSQLQTARRIIMLSHVKCDYHIGERYTDMQLVDSFTGNVHTPDRFNRKVYKTDVIPFCPAVHAVLGDDELIKPSYTGEAKREFLAQAERDHWAYKAPASVRQRMYDAGWLDPEVRYPLI